MEALADLVSGKLSSWLTCCQKLTSALGSPPMQLGGRVPGSRKKLVSCFAGPRRLQQAKAFQKTCNLPQGRGWGVYREVQDPASFDRYGVAAASLLSHFPRRRGS